MYRVLLFALLVSTALGCDDPRGGRPDCVPGEVQACGSAACAGMQTCRPDGRSFDDCVCSGPTDGGVDTGGVDTGGVDTGGGGMDTGGGGMDTGGTGPSTIFGTIAVTSFPMESGSVVEGINLDGRESTASDDATCFIEDQTAPDGRRGIDNAIVSLRALLASVDIEPRLSSSIAVEVSDIDSFVNDTSVSIRVNDSSYGGRIADGVLIADNIGTVRVSLVFAGMTPVSVYDAALRAGISAGGLRSVVLGGELELSEIVPVIASSLGAPVSLVRSNLESAADLQPGDGGLCTRISAGAI